MGVRFLGDGCVPTGVVFLGDVCVLRVFHPLGTEGFVYIDVSFSADGSVLTGVPFQGGVGGVTYIYSSVWERGVPTGVPLLCDGCMYTHGCSTNEAWVCIYSVTGVPLLSDGCVYTHGCSTAVGWVCTDWCSTAV